MKRFLPTSVQTRLALLIGALALTAAISAVLGIISAASFQRQLADAQAYAAAAQQSADAHSNLLKTQVAIKNTLMSNEYRAEDYSDYWLNSDAYDYYLFSQALRREDEPIVQELTQNSDDLGKQTLALFDALDGENVDFESLKATELDKIDPLIEELETQTGSLYNSDQNSMKAQIAAIQSSIQTNLLVGQISLLVLVGLVIWGVYEISNIAAPLDNLTGAIVAFENNTYSPDLLDDDISRPDEFGQLAHAVDGMAQSISESNRLKEQFLQAAQRFVPSEYLEFLEKDSITSVQLGDHVKAEMAVMFSDIRGFTSRSETMTAKENFDFVNEYLKLVSPLIQQHEGFIVKFLGDGMMAIFPYGVKDAVAAGIEKEKIVQEFNKTLKERGLPPISVGIGIHTGSMMVGMIGDELRMQGDAFSDNVNLTSRIEGLNKFFGTSMIISEDTLRQLPQPVQFKMRPLGKAVVKGRAAPLGMYEIYDGLPLEVIDLKDATRLEFELGLQLYTAGKFAEAGKHFNQVLEKDPGDKTAKLYLEYCADWLDRPLPENWDGAIVMDSK
jgi:class 3 adenylate cyclase